MNLIVYQVMQFQVMHVSDCRSSIERLTGTSVAELYLTVSCDINTLPQFSVIQMLFQILIYFRKQNIFIFLGECIPFHVYIIVCQFQGILNIFLVCAVEDRSGNVESKRCCCKA